MLNFKTGFLIVALLFIISCGQVIAKNVTPTDDQDTGILDPVPLKNEPGVQSIGTGLISSETIDTAADCPASNFLDVSTYEQHQNYPAPYLNVYCSADVMIIESNGIPNFEFVPITPNALQAQDYVWQIPLNPEIAGSTSSIPLLGAVAVTVNGLPIYGPNEAPIHGYADPYLDDILDYCNGHTGPRGEYHFHARPDCLFEDMAGNVSLVVAYAFDGFPILAPYICEDPACSQVTEVQSSWQRTSDARNAWEAHTYIAGSGILDECNGMVGADGSYRYYATGTFPYFLGCYRGVVNNRRAGVGGQPGSSAPQPGPGTAAGQGRPNLAAAAQQLAVSEQALRDALGAPPPDLNRAAQQLGVSVDALRNALGPPSQGGHGGRPAGRGGQP